MKRYFLSFLLTLPCLISHLTMTAESSLHIIDPQSWGAMYAGEISEMTMAVEPQGVFMKYDLYLTFDMNALPVGPNDSLEVEFFFNLPKEAIVCDSWLWIEDYISYGILMDADSASRTYEWIVNRRTDPSILFKRSETEYELRIYPITKNDPRKVKITFLLPMEWSADKALGFLPIKEFLPWVSSSSVNLILLNNHSMPNPKIMEYPGKSFTTAFDSTFGHHLITSFSPSQKEFDATLGFDAPMNHGVYVSYFPTQPNEGFYQMALNPWAQMDSLDPEKILFLLDYSSDNGEDFRTRMGEVVKDILSPKDSFNLMIKTPGGIASASSNWLAAEPTVIDSLFAPSTYTFSSVESIFALMRDGFTFINQHNDEGAVVLFSNNDSYTSVASCESFYHSLDSAVNISVPITIANYQHHNIEYKYYPELGRYVLGNNYLFNMLADRSGGYYENPFDNLSSMYNVLRKPVLEATRKFELLDVQTGTEVGFCYDRYEISPSLADKPIRSTILQTGKYYGDFPFEVSFFGISGQRFDGFDLKIPTSEMTQAGPALRKAWFAQEIGTIDGLHVSRDTRKDIIDLSREAKVLSFHTAFLCLEDSFQFGSILSDGGVVLSDELTDEMPVKVEAYPNPFIDNFRISIDNLEGLVPDQLKLIDMQGKVLHEFEIEETQVTDGSLQFDWNGSHLPSGIYMLIFEQGDEKQFVRLVKS